ncbi:MAG: L-threonylcarbamoyladenylate synthase [Chloroflexota bacterium]
MRTELLSADHPAALPHTVDILRNGGVIAFPTDTVYGLATMPFKPEWVEQLYTAKGRSSEKAIAILIGEHSQRKQVTHEMGAMAQRLARQFWPGPLTLIVPRHTNLPEALSARPNIGVRMPDHPVALALLRLAGPLAVTSANRSGAQNASTAAEVMEQLKGRIHLVLDGGATPGGVPSTVVDCTGENPIVLREGPISLADIEAALRLA